MTKFKKEEIVAAILIFLFSIYGFVIFPYIRYDELSFQLEQKLTENKILKTEINILQKECKKLNDLILNLPLGNPVDTVRVTSSYGWRTKPYKNFHSGIDIAANTWDNIYVTGNGTVIKTIYNNKIFGNYIIIKHSNGYKSLYGHLSKIFVKRNEKVNKGSIIGKAGNTGIAYGYHLHYEIHKNSHTVDPIKFLNKL
jgi:murein DD-endopeptidase MepM/ murein hydrolase activator NlpD